MQPAPSPLPINTVTGSNLMVGNDPSGANAIAAVRFTVPSTIDGATVDPSTVPATLTMKVADGAVGTPAVAACPIQANWQPADGGAWADRPNWSCSQASAPLTFSADGKTATAQLTPALQRSAGLYDLALVPKPGSTDPFSVQFQPAAPGSLALGGGTSPPPPSTPGVTEPEATPVPIVPETGVAVTPDLGASGLVSPPALPYTPAPATARPSPGATATTPGRFQATPVRKVGSKRGQRAVALGLLGALAFGLWWFGGQQARSPRLLGSLGEGREPAVSVFVATGGIGRFARPRTRPPPRL